MIKNGRTFELVGTIGNDQRTAIFYNKVERCHSLWEKAADDGGSLEWQRISNIYKLPQFLHLNRIRFNRGRLASVIFWASGFFLGMIVEMALITKLL